MGSRTRALRRSILHPLTSMLVERLDARELLSTMSAVPGVTVAPMYEAVSYAGTVPPSGALTPSQVRQAYGFNGVSFGGVAGDGTGETIAIVDAFDDPNIQADLNAFDAQFGLPAGTVIRVSQTGGTNYPATDPTGGWELEESLDVEWAHAVAPGAKILLVEASSSSDSDLLAAVDYAAAHANAVSMSWGGGEFSAQTIADSHFSHAGVAFVAASGDEGAPISWPAAAPTVLSVGGTSLSLGAGSAWSSEAGWSGSGGGPSVYESKPSYQADVVTQTTMRANPDVAFDASPATGFAVYDSFAYDGTAPGWAQVGGTSAGAPQWAALLAIVDQGRALDKLPALNASSPTEVMSILYGNATSGAFHDITSGSSTGTSTYSAGTGYDYVTGLGSPKANLVITGLVGTAPAASDVLTVSVSTPVTAATSFSVTVTARNSSGTPDAGYLGTVHFTSSDYQAVLPASYTFTAADKGVHTFTVTLETAGTQSLSVGDAAALAATASSLAVSPAAPTNLTAAAASSSAINLSWAAAAGATGYSIEQSISGSGIWTQVGTTAWGVTTYSDAGLAAGTTYDYRVRAIGGGLTSAYSNAAAGATASLVTAPMVGSVSTTTPPATTVVTVIPPAAAPTAPPSASPPHRVRIVRKVPAHHPVAVKRAPLHHKTVVRKAHAAPKAHVAHNASKKRTG